MSAPQSTFRIVLAGLVALAIAMGIGRFAFTPLLPLMQDDDLIAIPSAGLLATVHFLGYLVGALLAPWLIVVPRRALGLSLLLVALATFGMGLTDSFALWLLFRALCGICSALVLVLVSTFLVRTLADAGHPTMQGWVFSGVGAGIALAGLGTLAIAALDLGSGFGWQVLGVTALMGAMAVWPGLRDSMPVVHNARLAASDGRTPLAWPMILAYGATGLGYVIPATYLPAMAREVVSAPLLFGLIWPVFGAAAFVSTVLAAHLGRRFTDRGIWFACQLVMALGLLLPALWEHIAAIVLAGISVGSTFVIITMAGMKEAHRIAQPGDVQRHVAALTAAFAAGQAIGPLFAGWLYDETRSFAAPLLLTSAALTVAAVGLLRALPGNGEGAQSGTLRPRSNSTTLT